MKLLSRVSIIFVTLLAIVGLSSCNQGGQSIGVVDMMKIMQSDSFKAIASSMQSDDKSQQTKLQSAATNLQKANAEVSKAKGAAKTEAQAKAKAAEDKFNSLLTEYKQQQKLQQDKVKSELMTAVEKVAKSKGLSNVLLKQVVLYGNDTDITSSVIAQLKAKVKK